MLLIFNMWDHLSVYNRVEFSSIKPNLIQHTKNYSVFSLVVANWPIFQSTGYCFSVYSELIALFHTIEKSIAPKRSLQRYHVENSLQKTIVNRYQNIQTLMWIQSLPI